MTTKNDENTCDELSEGLSCNSDTASFIDRGEGTKRVWNAKDLSALNDLSLCRCAKLIHSDLHVPWVLWLVDCTARDWWRQGEHDDQSTGTPHVVDAANRALCESYRKSDLEVTAGDGLACFNVRLPARDM